MCHHCLVEWRGKVDIKIEKCLLNWHLYLVAAGLLSSASKIRDRVDEWEDVLGRYRCMVSRTRDNSPLETTLASVYMQMSLVHWVSLGHSIAVGFAKGNFHFFDTNFCFIPQYLGVSFHSLRRELPRNSSTRPSCLGPHEAARGHWYILRRYKERLTNPE